VLLIGLRDSVNPKAHMSCTASSGLDRSFLVTIKEIERGYIFLSKQQKIRTEKWVEKLVISGVENYVWKKHRNEYAKLLLHMVILKRLSAPFHMLPPDGQLCQFPKHFTSYELKDKAPHPHQVTFWSDIYNRFSETQMTGTASPSKRYRGVSESQYQESPSSNSFYSRDFTQNRSNEGEYKLQVDLLEQQLKEEKVRYGLNVQKLEHAHKVELSAYAEAVASTSAISHAPHNNLIPAKPGLVHEDQNARANSFRDQLQHQQSAESHIFDSNLQYGFHDMIGTTTGQPPRTNRAQSTDLIRSAVSDVSMGGSNYDMDTISDYDRRTPWVGFRSMAEANSDAGASDRRNTARDEKFATSSSASTYILPKRGGMYQMGSPVSLRRNKSQSTLEDELACFSRRDGHPSTARLNSFGNTSRSVGFTSADFRRNKTFSTGQNDDDFLAYIEEFQTEIKKLQDSSPMKKS
jgi:Domain of unknown function (DUF4485)